METRVHEIADGVYRLSTFVPAVTPDGFTFNQFLIDADEPMLFHTGQRMLFPSVSEAVARVMPVARLRWSGCAHHRGRRRLSGIRHGGGVAIHDDGPGHHDDRARTRGAPAPHTGADARLLLSR